MRKRISRLSHGVLGGLLDSWKARRGGLCCILRPGGRLSRIALIPRMAALESWTRTLLEVVTVLWLSRLGLLNGAAAGLY